MKSFPVPQARTHDRLERSLPPLVPNSQRLVTPLSFQQERLWPDGGTRPARVAVRVRGPFAADLLRGAVAELVRRHEVLRTTCREIDGWPRQEPHPPGTPAAVAVTETGPGPLAPDERDAGLDDLVRAAAREPFDLGRLPLVRWTVARLGPDDHAVVLVAHRAILDARSAVLLLREAASLYGAAGPAGVRPEDRAPPRRRPPRRASSTATTRPGSATPSPHRRCARSSPACAGRSPTRRRPWSCRSALPRPPRPRNPVPGTGSWSRISPPGSWTPSTTSPAPRAPSRSPSRSPRSRRCSTGTAARPTSGWPRR
ncbi:hypothetical protein GEV43_31570 [Actinomadura sp. J1-007]|nr:hypothetical protein [Actinomadura sp. J1-007]